MSQYSYGIIRVNNDCANGAASDMSGKLIRELIVAKFGATHIQYKLVHDDLQNIEDALRLFADDYKLDAIFTSGGTGFAPNDYTPEATINVITKNTPQLTLAMALVALEMTKFAVLCRPVSGIRNKTLIINFPGNRNVVNECFTAISYVILQALSILKGDDIIHIPLSKKTRQKNPAHQAVVLSQPIGNTVCLVKPECCNLSPPIDEHKKTLDQIYKEIQKKNTGISYESPVNIPPFRAASTNGYAAQASRGKRRKTVIGYIAANDEVTTAPFKENEIFKISSGAPVPSCANCIVQLEDTKLIESKNGKDKCVEMLVEPQKNRDIRHIGEDLKLGETLFYYDKTFAQLGVYEKSICASIGQIPPFVTLPSIKILTIGNQLIAPGEKVVERKIFDSNTTMLVTLLNNFGFEVACTKIVKENFDALKAAVTETDELNQFIISTGGVSMDENNFVKQVLDDLNYDIKFSRLNLKPGKEMTFASKFETNNLYFGLPGNAVSAFVTFHLFVLPALRYACGWTLAKCTLPEITVELLNDKISLDSRPEYARATIISKRSCLYAMITDSQISSRLKSIETADVLLHLPASTSTCKFIVEGQKLAASVLKHDFISKYE